MDLDLVLLRILLFWGCCGFCFWVDAFCYYLLWAAADFAIGLLRKFLLDCCGFCLRAAAVIVFGLLRFLLSDCYGFCFRAAAVFCFWAAAVIAFGLLRFLSPPTGALEKNVSWVDACIIDRVLLVGAVVVVEMVVRYNFWWLNSWVLVLQH